MTKRRIDLHGRTFGRLEVVSLHALGHHIKWNCRCACGNASIVMSHNLLNGATTSCGCLLRERWSANRALAAEKRAADMTVKETQRAARVAAKSVLKSSRAQGDGAPGVTARSFADQEMKRGMRAFNAQRAAAKNRSIEWRFSFAEWWMVWQRSGKWPLRGRHRGGYVMSRSGDVGPYSVENVIITTNRENFAEARSHAKKRDGVYFVLPGTRKPWWARWRNKHLGYFATEEEARNARDAAKLADPIVTAYGRRVFSAEHRANLSKAAAGRKLTEQHKKNAGAAISAALARKKMLRESSGQA